MVAEHERRLDGHGHVRALLAEPGGSSIERSQQVRAFKKLLERGPFLSRLTALHDIDASAASQRVVQRGAAAEGSREKLFADPSDRGRKCRRILAGDDAVVLVERRREELEERAMALLVQLDSREVADERRRERRVVLGEGADPVPAEPGGLLGVDVELAELTEGSVLERRAHFGRYLS
jgi:hypothetical protein